MDGKNVEKEYLQVNTGVKLTLKCILIKNWCQGRHCNLPYKWDIRQVISAFYIPRNNLTGTGRQCNKWIDHWELSDIVLHHWIHSEIIRYQQETSKPLLQWLPQHQTEQQYASSTFMQINNRNRTNLMQLSSASNFPRLRMWKAHSQKWGCKRMPPSE